MRITNAMRSGASTLRHGAHEFSVSLSTFTVPLNLDGTISSLLKTPQMACTICGTVATTWFPLDGGHDAQAAHIYHYLVTNPGTSIAAGVQAIRAKILALGAEFRADVNDLRMN